MKIAVYGASSPLIDDKYIIATEALGCELARRGHELVFGAGGVGVMGAIARGFRRGGGKIIGVLPKFFKEEGIEDLDESCDELILTDDMAQRKELFLAMSDAIISAPGGIGTYDEFFETLTLKQLGKHDKPLVLFSPEGFYDAFQQMMRHAEQEKFIRFGLEELYLTSDDPIEIADYLDGYASAPRQRKF